MLENLADPYRYGVFLRWPGWAVPPSPFTARDGLLTVPGRVLSRIPGFVCESWSNAEGRQLRGRGNSDPGKHVTAVYSERAGWMS